jgi:23S rRNA (cytosine1962-C5)-methyltransferase
MEEVKQEMFRNRLVKVFRHLSKQAKRMQVSCWRLYDHDLPEFPFCIEIYGEKIYVAEYQRRHTLTDEEHEVWLQKSFAVISEVVGIPVENIFVKLRKRKQGRLDQYQKLDEKRQEFIVGESGLKFIVNLEDYLDTGLFIDHRITRGMVREESGDKRVLNLFAYTGTFSVYAAAGGAAKVTTIDMSNTYLSWAKRNMELNGFSAENKYEFIQADVTKHIQSLTEKFDIIILDPPTFSNSARMENTWEVQRDHVSIINNCLKLLAPGGSLYFSTNFTKFVLAAEQINSSDIKDITKATTPFDFEGKLFRKCYKIV